MGSRVTMFLAPFLVWFLLLLGAVEWAGSVADQNGSQTRFLIPGRCPEVVLPDGFDKEEFGGVWYRVGGLPNFEEHSVNCTVYDYISTDFGYVVNSTGLGKNGSQVDQNVTLNQVKPGTGRFSTTIRDFEAEMVVLSTDYTSFTCLFSCYNFQESHKVHFGWILSRNSTLEEEKVAMCTKELKNVSIPIKNLRGTYQGDECTTE